MDRTSARLALGQNWTIRQERVKLDFGTLTTDYSEAVRAGIPKPSAFFHSKRLVSRMILVVGRERGWSLLYGSFLLLASTIGFG